MTPLSPGDHLVAKTSPNPCTKSPDQSLEHQRFELAPGGVCLHHTAASAPGKLTGRARAPVEPLLLDRDEAGAASIEIEGGSELF